MFRGYGSHSLGIPTVNSAYWVALLLGVTALIYLGTSVGYVALKRPGMALAFFGYVLGNIGFIEKHVKLRIFRS